MGCACEAVHGFPCQFPDETEFYAFDGQQWCLFHLPLEDAKGNKSPKDCWERDEPDWQRFQNVVFYRLRNPQDKSPHSWVEHPISDLRAVVFPHYFDFTIVEDTTFYPVFRNATFGVKTLFEMSSFGDGADFCGVHFGNETSFDKAHFEDFVTFSRARFGDEISFRNAVFHHHIKFDGAHFGNCAQFDDAHFGDGATFEGTRFGDGATFANARFGDAATFDEAHFGDQAKFDGAHLDYEASFDCAHFGNRTTFRGVSFGKASSFGDAYFGKRTIFNGAKIGGWSKFSGTHFGEETQFDGAHFGDEMGFDGAIFGDGVTFNNTHFGNVVWFGGAHFGDGAAFKAAYLGDEAIFYKANFAGSANFEAGTTDDGWGLFRGIDFRDAEFHGCVNFENRQFMSAACFERAVFHDIAQFHGCTFHPDMSFHKTTFKKTKGQDDSGTEALERAYRTLKLAMEELRARNEEARFFALEMECHRQQEDVPRLERAFASLYKLTSNYGRSINRPVGCLAVSLVVFVAIYWIIGCLTNPSLDQEQGQFPYDLAVLTLEQLVKPFSVWTRSSSSAQLPLVENNPLLLPILASLQSLFNLSLLAVFLLALRRRFKMD